MALPPRSFHTILEISIKWSVLPADVIGWAIDGHFDISMALPPVQAGGHPRAGLVHIDPADVLPLFRRDGSGPRAVAIRRFRLPDGEEQDWQWIGEPAEGVQATAADILLTRRESDRFEKDHGVGAPLLNAPEAGERPPARRRAGPGAPARYDWDAFYCAMIRRVHDEGVPETQTALVRDMQDWFDNQADTPPDESTIRRKVQAVWRELHR